MTDVIRFTYQGTHFRIKVPEVLNLGTYDFLKFCHSLVNQEGGSIQAVNMIDQMLDVISDHYDEFLRNGIFDRDFIRYEKHFIYMMRLHDELKYKDADLNKRSSVTVSCRVYYSTILQHSENRLLNQFGLVFVPYVNKTGFSGTAYTLLQMFYKDLINEEALNGIREQERRYCS